MEAIKEIINNLKREIRLYESLDSFIDYYDLQTDELLSIPFSTFVTFPEVESVYHELYSRYPYLPLKISREVFPSWSITHTQEDLRGILKLK